MYGLFKRVFLVVLMCGMFCKFVIILMNVWVKLLCLIAYIGCGRERNGVDVEKLRFFIVFFWYLYV